MTDQAKPRADDPLERARAFIEANASETFSLETLASVAGLSAYHFSRQFTARFGLAPMAFARERRMDLAAERLGRDGRPALIELAFDLGFETQEGFTRAFKRAHGVTPGRFRRQPRGKQVEIPTMTDVASPLRLIQSPTLARKPGFRVAGVSGVFDETTRNRIPALWPRLIERLPVPSQIGDDASFGVCWGAAGSGGAFHYMAAVPIDPNSSAPEGLETKDVPAQTYLVFRQETDGTDLHRQMQAAVREIWGERLPKSGYKLAGGPDLEAYPPRFQPDVPSWVEWWVPVEA
jgi:AraC family transcriptional regulator